MSIIGEIGSIVHDIAELVRNTRDFAEIVKDSRKFLTRKHPQAKMELQKLLSEMRKAVVGLATVTGVITGFRFTISDPLAAEELTRFNTYVIAHKTKAADLRQRISSLKGSCDAIRAQHDKLNESGGGGWTGMFRLFGNEQSTREHELALAFGTIYEHDQTMLSLIWRVLNLADQALADANQALGPPGQAYPAQIQTAASIMGVYATTLYNIEAELQSVVSLLDEAILALK